jgi:hypothetical protein
MVAHLQQISKEMQAAVAEWGAARLPVVLHTKQLQQAQAFAQWSGKHAGLLQALELQLNFRRADMTAHIGAAMAALEPALQAAFAADSMQLQTVSITGSSISASTVESTSAARLTSLRAEVNCHCPSTMQALAALTGPRTLRLTNTAPTPPQPPMWSPPVAAEDDALAPLAAGLQQLTQLGIGHLRPVQLRWLPPRLQQLHVTVGLWSPAELDELSAWVEQHASILSTLKLVWYSTYWDYGTQVTSEALDGLAEAFEAAAATAKAAAAPPAAAAAAAAVVGLQSFCIDGYNSAAPLMKHFPAGKLTCLVCPLDWRIAKDIDAVCKLTALQSLQVLPWGLVGEHYVSCPGGASDNMLSALTALQGLTSLELSATRRIQLCHLRLPQLLQLSVTICRSSPQGAELDLSWLASLRRLTLVDEGTPLQDSDRLPLSLRCLMWPGLMQDRGCSVRPLLALRCFEELQLHLGAATKELSQLTALRSLSGVKLAVESTKNVAGAAGWHLLPLTALGITSPEIPAVVLQSSCSLRGLKSLGLWKPDDWDRTNELGVTLQQLVAGLQRMTALQHLIEAGFIRMPVDTRASPAVDSMIALLQVVGSLRELESVFLVMPVSFSDAGVQRLSGMLDQLLPDYMVPCCKVSRQNVSIDFKEHSFTL